MKSLRILVAAFGCLFVCTGLAPAQTWTLVTRQPTFKTDTALLLMDGNVMMHEYNTPNWWKLTPDNTGSYVNGTWSKIASMPPNYAPLYFASAVLPDGRVIIEGGEYNFLVQDQTNLGAIYDPVKDSWTAVTPPSGWSEIGDSPSIVLANGTFMLGRNQTTLSALFNANNLTWTSTGTGKKDDYEEEGWVLLPDTTVLTTDAASAPGAEKYVPAKGQWIAAGNTIVKLADPGSLEIGPLILRPDGTVFAAGAKASGAAHTAIYTPPTRPSQPGTWVAGPDFPNGNGMADGPASILPDGNILVETSPGIFGNAVTFYEFDGVQFNQVPSPASHGVTCYQGRMLVLPTGQVLYSVADGNTATAAVYTASGNSNPNWAPTILQAPTTIVRGHSYSVGGTQFNGLSNGAAYGDDAQMNTNYPLVRITNNASGHVSYARAHNPSNMGVATGSRTVFTHFDVPSTAETGPSSIEVVANGLASNAVPVTVN